jgi:hypothetical protein
LLAKGSFLGAYQEINFTQQVQQENKSTHFQDRVDKEMAS